MGTHKDVEESENVILIMFMEEENIRKAEENSFIGVLTTNTNLLTQVCCDGLINA